MRISCRKSVAEHINYDPATQISQDGVCIACHGRQNAEHNLLTDVHRAIDAANPGEMPKFSCMGCHQETEVHGDQAALDSQLDNPKTSCAQSGCHERELKIAGGKKATGGACKGDKGSKVNERCETFHLQHVVDVDCTSCHVQSNTTCNSCHFDSELDHRKRFYRQIPAKGFSFLMNFKDIQNPDMTKVRTATYQSLTVGTVCVDGACDTDEAQAFVMFAPYTDYGIKPLFVGFPRMPLASLINDRGFRGHPGSIHLSHITIPAQRLNFKLAVAFRQNRHLHPFIFLKTNGIL